MSGPADRFDGVIAVGEKSRAELAERLADEFRHDPKRFDPRSLERLGATGLRQFLEGIGEIDAQPDSLQRNRQAPHRKEQTGNTSKTLGWAHLRRPEWPGWISGMVLGVRAGGIVAGSGLLFLLTVERIAPLVRGMLS